MKLSASPKECRSGWLKVSVGIGPIKRMFSAEEWQRPLNTAGGAVFEGRVGEVVENITCDTQQHLSTNVFNLDAHIYDVRSGHPVPYLIVRAIVQQAGGILYDVPLVPVARLQHGTAGLHYGNNLSLNPHGDYQIICTIQPSPLTGTESSASLEFTIHFPNTGAAS